MAERRGGGAAAQPIPVPEVAVRKRFCAVELPDGTSSDQVEDSLGRIESEVQGASRAIDNGSLGVIDTGSLGAINTGSLGAINTGSLGVNKRIDHGPDTSLKQRRFPCTFKRTDNERDDSLNQDTCAPGASFIPARAASGSVSSCLW